MPSDQNPRYNASRFEAAVEYIRLSDQMRLYRCLGVPGPRVVAIELCLLAEYLGRDPQLPKP